MPSTVQSRPVAPSRSPFDTHSEQKHFLVVCKNEGDAAIFHQSLFDLLVFAKEILTVCLVLTF